MPNILMAVNPRQVRRGVIVPLAAVLLIVMVGMVAYSVDSGYMAVVRGELQNAADAAAMAAAQKLMSRELLEGNTVQTTGVTAARTAAVSFGGYHKGGGKSLALDRNDANSADGDIVVGFIKDPSDPNSSFDLSTAPYNSVKVKVHRDDVRNGPLSLFFTRVWGKESHQMEATATATAEGYIRGFKIRTNGPTTSKLIPFALDMDVWNDQVVNSNGADTWTYNPNTNAYTSGSDNIHETKLFPNKGVSPGNFGTIDIGSANNSTSDLDRQIRYGPNAADFSHYANGEFKLENGGTLVTGGDTGISAGMKDALLAIRGQPRILPLYRPPVTGNGNNSSFTIVAFVGVVITDIELTGSQTIKHITIQPEFVIDSGAIGGGTSSSSTYVYKGVFLTR